MAVAMGELIQKAREQLGDMTGLELGSTLSALKDEEGVWRVALEAVEKKSLPDSQDILATYKVSLDDDGNMMDFSRTRMRKRGDTATPEDTEQ